MQRLQPMQNAHFGSKIKILTYMSKSILQIIQSCSVQKSALKTINIPAIRPFLKSPIMQRLLPMQSIHFGSIIKTPKNMSKSILPIIQSCSVQKTPLKTLNLREMRPFEKSAIMQGQNLHLPMQNLHFKSKIKIPKTMSKSILQLIYSCSV